MVLDHLRLVLRISRDRFYPRENFAGSRQQHIKMPTLISSHDTDVMAPKDCMLGAESVQPPEPSNSGTVSSNF